MTIDLESTDYYRILQVDPFAEYAVIRAAHRALAFEHHPDMGGLESDMATLNVAWTVLSDPVKRAAYDHDRRLRQDGERYRPETATPAAHRVGSIIDFGRYAGWSIPEIARSDSDYLEWLVRTPTAGATSARSNRSSKPRSRRRRRSSPRRAPVGSITGECS